MEPLTNKKKPRRRVAVLTVESFDTEYETFRKTSTVFGKKDDDLEGFFGHAGRYVPTRT